MSVVSEPRSFDSVVPVEHPAVSRQRLTHVLVLAGVALVALGAYLPWLFLFNGLTAIPGFRLGGGVPAGVTVAAAGLVLVAVHRGGAWLRWVAALGSAAAAAYVLYLAHGVLGYVADPGPTGPLLMPQTGVGAYVMAAGAVCVLAAAIVARPLSRAGVAPLPLAIAGLTFAAGWVHLLLAPEHLEEHAILGTGFVLAGVAQVVLSVLVIARPSVTTFALVVALNVAIMAVYLYAVLVGLPFGDAGMADMPGVSGMDMSGMDDHTDGLVMGSGEPVDIIGVATFVAEMLGVGLVMAHLRGRRPAVSAGAS